MPFHFLKLLGHIAVETGAFALDFLFSRRDEPQKMDDWIEVGQPAPDFTLVADDGSEFTLSKQRGRPVILYFYPKDLTPGCTLQACRMRDRRDEIQQLGAVVAGISADDVAQHVKFREQLDLNFPLLADTDHKVSSRYGAWRLKNLYGVKRVGMQRSTYLIDAQGRVGQLWKRVRINRHDDEIVDALKALSKG